jgi:hypothetical protein
VIDGQCTRPERFPDSRRLELEATAPFRVVVDDDDLCFLESTKNNVILATCIR